MDCLSGRRKHLLTSVWTLEDWNMEQTTDWKYSPTNTLQYVFWPYYCLFLFTLLYIFYQCAKFFHIILLDPKPFVLSQPAVWKTCCVCAQDAVTICTLGIGTAFGESILDNTPRHATIVSRETSELLRIEQREFKSLWEVRDLKTERAALLYVSEYEPEPHGSAWTPYLKVFHLERVPCGDCNFQTPLNCNCTFNHKRAVHHNSAHLLDTLLRWYNESESERDRKRERAREREMPVCLCLVLAVYCCQSLLWLSAAFTAQGMMHQTSAPRAYRDLYCELCTVCVKCAGKEVSWEFKCDKCILVLTPLWIKHRVRWSFLLSSETCW